MYFPADSVLTETTAHPPIRILGRRGKRFGPRTISRVLSLTMSAASTLIDVFTVGLFDVYIMRVAYDFPLVISVHSLQTWYPSADPSSRYSGPIGKI